jgi:hypothetical protein
MLVILQNNPGEPAARMGQRSSAQSFSVRPPPITPGRAILIVGAAFAAAVIMTWPLASDIGRLGRTENSGDARFSVWNVAWVAHALTTSPRDLYDANIFYPHRRTLAFSEANIGAGALAVPAWAATRNPFAAHNSVVLVAFTLSFVFMWLLVRRLTGDDAAAVTSAILFAFCPYVFAHTAHIQLLMTAGIPLSLLAFHRLAESPSPARGLELGVALGVQGLFCAYYGVSAGLTVGYATLFYAWSRRLWTSRDYWTAVAIAAVMSIVIVLPFFLPYLVIQEDTGFSRSLDDARRWSALVRSYLASGANAHSWMLPLIRDWNRAVLFPGFVAVALGVAGLVIAYRDRTPSAREWRFTAGRETALLYASIGVLTFWASLGPEAGLYTLFYKTIPVFSFLRAPERMGVVVVLSLAVLAGYTIRALRNRVPERRMAIGVAAAALSLFDLNSLPFDWREARPIPPVYRQLAVLPRGPLAEFPFFDRRIDFHLHTTYMLNSTVHWQPLLNGYSDHIPADFRTLASTLASFPSQAGFDALRTERTRYLALHRGRGGYDRQTWPEIERRLQPYLEHLKVVAEDQEVVIYEILSWPK